MSSRFGKFLLLQRIGGGRLSQVFRVSRAAGAAQPPAPVALKRVHPSLIGEPDFVLLVIREAGLLTRIAHENLCACQELGVIDGCPFLTLDLVEGCTLRALMRRLSRQGVRLPPSAVLALAHQLAEVLDYLQRDCPTPLVHLDLSPQNVMVSLAGRVKLIDFGIARHLDGHEPPPVGERIAGTIGYMSPEQARGGPVDGRADQFGLGVLLWELLSGRRLFRGNTAETWQRMRAGATPPARAALHEAPEELRLVVERLLQPEPAARFPHVGAALAALGAVSSAPLSGMRPLAALVARLMAEESFDPFDAQRPPREPELGATDVAIPRGDAGGAVGGDADYAELQIEVDEGDGSPSSLVRSLVAEGAGEAGADTLRPTPTSPFLELGERESESEEGEPAAEAG